MDQVELRRAYRTQESLVRYWAQQAVALCKDIEDESLEEYAAPVRAADKALQRDRRIIVIGGAKCGKSSILAGLVGAPVIASHRMEGHYLCWRFSCRDGDATHSRFIPQDHLNGLELVDTAACSGEAADTCRTLLQGADVIVAVVDSRAPEMSPVWDMLAELPEALLSSCLLAITFTDILGAEQILKLKDTLRDLAATKLKSERPLPLYQVSPANQSSMQVFRSRVQDVVSSARMLRSDIRRLSDRTSDLVDKQSRILRARHSVSLTDISFLAGIDQEIDVFLANQMKTLDSCLEKLRKALNNTLPPLLQQIRYSFGWTLSPTTLLRLELMGADTDRALYHQMEEEVLHQQEAADVRFVESCKWHWGDVGPRMKKTLECEIGEFPQHELEKELERLRRNLCRDLYDPFYSMGLRHSFCGLFIAQAGWMRACMIFLCFLLAVGGTLGYMGQDMLGLACVAAAALVWLGGTLGHQLAYRRICDSISKLTGNLCRDMEASMSGVMEQLIISRVTAYRNLYTKPREKVARQNNMLAPLQERQKEIRIHLRSIAPRL